MLQILSGGAEVIKNDVYRHRSSCRSAKKFGTNFEMTASLILEIAMVMPGVLDVRFGLTEQRDIFMAL